MNNSIEKEEEKEELEEESNFCEDCEKKIDDSEWLCYWCVLERKYAYQDSVGGPFHYTNKLGNNSKGG